MSSNKSRQKPCSCRRCLHARHQNISRILNIKNTKYQHIIRKEYLINKYGVRKSNYILVFINCIHKKLIQGVDNIGSNNSNNYNILNNSWIKSKLFLLLVILSQRGGPEYYNTNHSSTKDDENEENKVLEDDTVSENNSTKEDIRSQKTDKDDKKKQKQRKFYTLNEQIIRRNIKMNFTETKFDENFVFSSIWANFMEGLINHYLEVIIIPQSETKVCQQLYKPMMKIISLYNEYNDLMEKSEKNGFLQNTSNIEENSDKNNNESTINKQGGNATKLESTDIVANERLHRAQQLLYQAKQDIPKTISKELTLLSDMYSTLSADEQDYQLDEFVCCAEEFIELEYLPALIDVLFRNATNTNFWKIMLVLEPFFYYIEGEETENSESDDVDNDIGDDEVDDKQDPRVITLEKICEVAAKQKWI